MRTTAEVFSDHLERRKQGDIAANYAPDVIFLTGTGIFRGHQGVRDSAKELSYYTDDAAFMYKHTEVEGEYAFLEWTAGGKGKQVSDGADAFVITNGKIVMQAINYSVKHHKENS